VTGPMPGGMIGPGRLRLRLTDRSAKSGRMHSSGGMARAGSGRTKPKPLTLADVERMARAHGAGEAWDQLTPAQRRQWAARVQKQEDRERAAQEKARAASAEQASKAFDRFMDQFWAPVRKEQAAVKRKAAAKKS